MYLTEFGLVKEIIAKAHLLEHRKTYLALMSIIADAGELIEAKHVKLMPN